MRTADLLRLTGGAIRAQRLRSLLTGLGIAVGIASVVLLTAIGEGIQRFVLAEFTQFGTHLLVVTPGKTQTFGLSAAVIGSTRPLSLEDARAIERLPEVRAVVPLVQGNAAVEWQGRSRRVWVLGSKLRRELFGHQSPLGERVRIGGETYRVIGGMQPKGQMLGFDLDDSVYIPVGRALALFDREGLMEIDVLYRAEEPVAKVVERIHQLLLQRHGHEDFTLTTQDQMLEVLGSVLDVLTLAVAALGAISLAVGAIGVLTIMTISVNERVAEIGLLRALGASQGQVLGLFLGEALVLGTLGGLAGVGLGLGGALAIGWLIPALPVHISWPYVGLSLGVALGIGLLAGVLPALRAARLDPVEALRGE
jgi:putative ABC transport system permease protein